MPLLVISGHCHQRSRYKYKRQKKRNLYFENQVLICGSADPLITHNRVYGFNQLMDDERWWRNPSIDKWHSRPSHRTFESNFFVFVLGVLILLQSLFVIVPRSEHSFLVLKKNEGTITKNKAEMMYFSYSINLQSLCVRSSGDSDQKGKKKKKEWMS